LCNLYSVTKGQQAIRELAGAMRDRTGNPPPLYGIFPGLGRLIEYDPAYCDVILRRFEAVTGASAILARTGQTFEDGAAASTQPET
jgi:hypothetical protein